MRKFCLVLLFVGIAILGLKKSAADVYVLQEGDGTAWAGTGDGTIAAPVIVQHFGDLGASLGSINMPTTTPGTGTTPNAFTLAPAATGTGHMSLSTDGQYLMALGYSSPVSTAAVRGFTAAAAPRTIATIKLSNGAVDTQTALSDAFSGGTSTDPRSVVSTDGTKFWAFGNGSTAGSAGPRYVASAGATTTSTQLSASPNPTNVRVGKIVNGQLYESSASGTFVGISTIGSGLPTTSGQTTTVAISTSGTGAGTPSPYNFWFKDSRTVYIADNRPATATANNGGGIQKFIGKINGDYNSNGVVDAADEVLWRKGDLSADSNGDTIVDQTDYDFWRTRFGNTTPDSWSFAYTLQGGTSADALASTDGIMGLDGRVDGSGNVILFGTTANISTFNVAQTMAQTRLITVTDTGVNSAFTTLSTSTANSFYRGVVYVPTAGAGLNAGTVPEPASATLFVLGMVAMGWRRRRA